MYSSNKSVSNNSGNNYNRNGNTAYGNNGNQANTVHNGNGWIEREINSIKRSYEEEIKLLEVSIGCELIVLFWL